MKNIILLLSILLFSCTQKMDKDSNNIETKPKDSIPIPANYISVLTQHNNNSRSGWNNQETILTTSNVNYTNFGKLFTLPVDDQVYAQPLVVSNVMLENKKRNIVYIATVNNSIYAFDADAGNLLWQRNYTATNGYNRPPKNTDMKPPICGGNYKDFSGNIGIVGTPVIDSVAGIIYFVARSANTYGTSFIQHLHAVDIKTGNEIFGSPVVINPTYQGTGRGNVFGTIYFNSQKQNQRQALTLTNGIVYVSFSSHCDWGPYHGWIVGFDSKTLTQKIVYNTTPNGTEAGIWESGMGLAVDAEGNLYCVTGNGTVGDNNDPRNLINRGESALKLTPTTNTLQVSSFFTPYNYSFLESYDLDYGGMGAFLVPNTSLFFTGCKDGNIYILNKDNMGGLGNQTNNIFQTIALNNPNAHLRCQPSFFKGNGYAYVYVWSETEPLRAIPMDLVTNRFDYSKQITSSVNGPIGQNGAVLSVSSNGSKDSTGIVWASHAVNCDANHLVCSGILRAFDASDVKKELWNNRMDIARDGSGTYAKFASPTIVNGKVYLPTFSNQIVVYGLK